MENGRPAALTARRPAVAILCVISSLPRRATAPQACPAPISPLVTVGTPGPLPVATCWCAVRRRSPWQVTPRPASPASRKLTSNLLSLLVMCGSILTDVLCVCVCVCVCCRWEEARSICTGAGARLCTVEELEADETAGEYTTNHSWVNQGPGGLDQPSASRMLF